MSSTTSSPELGSNSHQLGLFVAELRQARGLSYNDVSARIKYSVIQLKALEQENWDALPHGMPLRWMIKSYARFLETDENVLLGMLDVQEGHNARNTPKDVRKGAGWNDSDMPLYSEPTQRSWGWLIIIAVLLLIALFYALDQGWIPEDWLVFNWLKGFRS